MLKILIELFSKFLSSRQINDTKELPKTNSENKKQTPTTMVTSKKLNKEGLDLIKSFEGLKKESYKDIVGVWTIGYGTTGTDIGPNLVWTIEQCEARLLKDLEYFEKEIEKCIITPVTDNQFSAIVSLSYNVGINAVKKSTLLRLLNSKDYAGAADQFLRWNKAGGKEVAGLTRRRSAERELFLKA